VLFCNQRSLCKSTGGAIFGVKSKILYHLTSDLFLIIDYRLLPETETGRQKQRCKSPGSPWHLHPENGTQHTETGGKRD
jgi:hypothetical protein